jgi:hypothetical protein
LEKQVSTEHHNKSQPAHFSRGKAAPFPRGRTQPLGALAEIPQEISAN